MGLPLLAMAVVALGQGQPRFQGEWHIEYAPAHHIRLTWTSTRECPEKKVGGWEVYAAKPPTLPYQTVTTASLKATGIEAAIEDLRDGSPRHVSLMGIRLVGAQAFTENRLTAESTYEVTTYCRVLKPGPSPTRVEPLTDSERNLSLAKTDEFDFDSKPFQDYLDTNHLRRREGESVLAFAYRVYRFVRTGMKYRADAPFDSTTLSVDCQTPWGHCGNYSRRVVGIMRANRIPARMSFGHWIVGGTKVSTEGQYHTRSEIYVDNVGWVLLDTSRGVPDGGWRTERDVDCGFANDEGWFFVFHLGSSLIVPTKTWGPQPQEHLQNIYMPAVGGSWNGSKTSYRFAVEELPIG